ncbi:A/G-specific adenine glycosylase [uncultured Helicobacter sp.]|uniref:A/G-specific adenine glycosylase n=1 Tax=uncultured Helicobacter sp. TaxID=175537 RepID=UPI00374E372F
MSARSALDALPAFHTQIAQWYAKCGRVELPWRNLARDGSQSYEVYISEIMLQQTQVSRVLEEFYFPFLRAFPSLRALADSSEQEVLRLWQGLGYYTRARNLRKCAQICVQKHGGMLPRGVEKLKSLPGIGDYSAGAISCFGFGESVGFVDSNIKRVFSRLFALSNPTHSQLQSLATKLLDTNDSFSYNQALLDIGALVCRARALCLVCPIREFCKGSNAPHRYPQKITRVREDLVLHLFVIVFCQSHKDFIALIAPQRDLSHNHSQLYAGLYNLPMLPTPLPSMSKSFTHIGRFKHAYTKYNITAEVLCTRCADRQAALNLIDSLPFDKHENLTFVRLDSLPTLPLSNLSHKALKLLP